MELSTYPRLVRPVLTVLTGFTLVLLVATLVTTGPVRGTSIELLSGVAVLLPAGAAMTLLFRRRQNNNLPGGHHLLIPLVLSAVCAMAAALLVTSSRDSAAVLLLALTAGTVTGMSLRRCHYANLVLVAFGGVLGFGAFTAGGPAAIVGVGAVVTLLAAIAVSVSSAFDSAETEPADESGQPEPELISART